MKIYISGPISNVSSGMSFWAFHDAADIIRRGGHSAVNPRTISYWELSWKTYMQIAFDILNSGEIDAVYMLEGWQDSRGATLERYLAQIAGIPVAYQSKADRLQYGNGGIL